MISTTSTDAAEISLDLYVIQIKFSNAVVQARLKHGTGLSYPWTTWRIEKLWESSAAEIFVRTRYYKELRFADDDIFFGLFDIVAIQSLHK